MDDYSHGYFNDCVDYYSMGVSMKCPKCGYDPEMDYPDIEMPWWFLLCIIALIGMVILAAVAGIKGGGGLTNCTIYQDEAVISDVLPVLEIAMSLCVIVFVGGLLIYFTQRGWKW